MAAAKIEALPAATGQGFSEQAQTVSHQHTSGEPDSKAFATMAARLALAGYSLHQLADGSYRVARQNFSARLRDFEALGQLVDQIGGRS
jgi:hypothetical protein